MVHSNTTYRDVTDFVPDARSRASRLLPQSELQSRIERFEIIRTNADMLQPMTRASTLSEFNLAENPARKLVKRPGCEYVPREERGEERKGAARLLAGTLLDTLHTPSSYSRSRITERT